MKIQKRISALQPYVIGIRFTSGMTVVDVILQNGWKVPQHNTILSAKDDSNENYYMFYTEQEDLGLDDILDMIEVVINLNIEREKKYELLKVKTEELKQLFKGNSLTKLQNMKFILGGDSLIPNSMPEDFDDIQIGDIDSEPPVVEAPVVEAPVVEVPVVEAPKKNGKSSKKRVGNQEIELPPKGEITLEEYSEPDIVCKCGPDEICPVCESEKMAY